MICCNCSPKKQHLDIDKAHGGPTRCLARLLTVSLLKKTLAYLKSDEVTSAINKARYFRVPKTQLARIDAL